MRSFFVCSLAAASFSVFLVSTTLGASFAQSVVAYSPGAGAGLYTNPAAALGAPDGITGENGLAMPFFGGAVMGPFNSAYQNDELVRVGEGGSLTLRLDRYVNTGAGAEFGLIENVSFFDPSFPSGTTSSPAVVFGADNARVEVSQDGVNFVGLTGGSASDVNFDMPSLYYLNAGPFDETAPTSPLLADFGKPFTPAGGLSAFDGKSSYVDVLSVFDGSAGGKWLDASASGLGAIGYIRLSVPDDNDPSTVNTLELDSILTNSAQLGGVVPEPTMLPGIVAMISIRRSRR